MATVTIHMPDGRTYQMDIEKWAQLDTWGYPPVSGLAKWLNPKLNRTTKL